MNTRHKGRTGKRVFYSVVWSLKKSVIRKSEKQKSFFLFFGSRWQQIAPIFSSLSLPPPVSVHSLPPSNHIFLAKKIFWCEWKINKKNPITVAWVNSLSLKWKKKTFSCIFLTITVRCTRRRAWLEMLDCIKELFLGPWTLSYCWVPRHQHLGHEDAVSCTLAIKSKTIDNNADLMRNC